MGAMTHPANEENTVIQQYLEKFKNKQFALKIQDITNKNVL